MKVMIASKLVTDTREKAPVHVPGRRLSSVLWYITAMQENEGDILLSVCHSPHGRMLRVP